MTSWIHDGTTQSNGSLLPTITLTHRTYCEGLTGTGGTTPNQVYAGKGIWGIPLQTQVQTESCSQDLSWQPQYSVGGGPLLVLLDQPATTPPPTPLGLCQSSQPLYSAYRDPTCVVGQGQREAY